MYPPPLLLSSPLISLTAIPKHLIPRTETLILDLRPDTHGGAHIGPSRQKTSRIAIEFDRITASLGDLAGSVRFYVVEVVRLAGAGGAVLPDPDLVGAGEAGQGEEAEEGGEGEETHFFFVE